MTLMSIWRSFQPRLSFSRPLQQSLACFRVARSPSNSWASCLYNICPTGVKTVEKGVKVAVEFVGCRGSVDVSGQTFALSCPAGQIISIKSAAIGYDAQWNPDVNSPKCSSQNTYCWLVVTTHGSIEQCNGQRNCSISQSIFTFTNKWCDGKYQKDLNILEIRYHCIPGK